MATMDAARIGVFAQLTGLSIKALRWSDEQGVLKPDYVDPRTRCRAYSEGQLDEALTIKALRDAGVPLASVVTVLAGESDAAEVLAGHREAVEEERRVQDVAFAAAARFLAEKDGDFGLRVELADAVPYLSLTAATIAPADAQGGGQAEDAVAQALERAYGALQRAGVEPAGTWWLCFAESSAAGSVDVNVYWPLERQCPAAVEVLGAGASTGTWPGGREVVVECAVGTDEAATSYEPGLLAMIHVARSRGEELAIDSVRQISPWPAADGGMAVRLSASLGGQRG